MKLLVSIVSASEVAPAVAGGADIIDVKNPAEGALGANFPHVIREARKVTPPELEVSATIGDVPNLPGTVSLAALGAAVCGVQYVKVGLFGTGTRRDAVFLLKEACRAVHGQGTGARVIAAAYADAPKVGALPPLELPAAAAEAGVDGCLLDTAIKGEGTLFTNLSDDQLRDFVAQCRSAGLICGLAGSIGAEDMAHACEFEIDLIGVRSAVCNGGRVSGRVDALKVRRLKDLICANELRGSNRSRPVP